MVREVKALGLETCATLGMLSLEQATELEAAGLDYYNHNLVCKQDSKAKPARSTATRCLRLS